MERFFESPEKKWGYTCSGNFQTESMNSSNYIKNKTCGVTDAGLQETARLCPVSLTYYAFCLHNGNYSVKLQFAEIVFAMDQDYSSRGKRVFDVYIQGEKKLENFNIKKETGGEAYKANNQEFVANVHDNQLVIHFYWAGKGSLSNSPLLNGPLVSAISVTPNFTISGEKKLSAGQITGITVGSALAPILLLAFLWKMGLIGNKEFKKVQIDVKGKNFTLQQIIDATRNFSPTMEIGRGRFGVVYKAELADKLILAVKKINPDLMQDKLKNELRGEIDNLKPLEQENLIELYDGYSKKGLHLLIYEYMEKGSLHQAVLDPNPSVVLDWEKRFNICLGLAKALKYLHEQPILHRNIKASNILLDGSYNPKLSDFGWARLYNEEDPFMNIKPGTDRVYIAQEYYTGQAISAKADVYSYGIVVLEVFSGRPAIDDRPNQAAAYLLDDARIAQADGRLDKLVDRKMVNYERKLTFTVLNLAIMCIDQTADLRPTMSQVVSVLSNEKTIDQISQSRKKLPQSSQETLTTAFAKIPVSSFPMVPSRKVIEIPADTSVAETVKILSECNIMAAPVKEEDVKNSLDWKERYLGIIDYSAIVFWVLESAELAAVSLSASTATAAGVGTGAVALGVTGPAAFAGLTAAAEKGRGKDAAIAADNLGEDFYKVILQEEPFKSTTVRTVLKSYRWAPFFPVATESSMLNVLLLLSKYRLRNVPVMEPGSPDIKNFITQTAVVQGLEQCKGRDWFDRIASAPISDFGLPFMSSDKVVCIQKDELILEAFKRMKDNHISGLPAVEGPHKKIVGSISIRDIRHLLLEPQLFKKFRQLRVMDFMETISPNKEAGKVKPPVTCRRDVTLGGVIDRLASNSTHRIYVVAGDGNEVIGVITLRDVISCFVYEPPNHSDDYFGFPSKSS